MRLGQLRYFAVFSERPLWVVSSRPKSSRSVCWVEWRLDKIDERTNVCLQLFTAGSFDLAKSLSFFAAS